MTRHFGIPNPEAPMDDASGDYPHHFAPLCTTLHHFAPEPIGRPKSNSPAQLWLSALILIAVLGMVVYSCTARARDLGQWDDVGHSEEVRAFFRSLVQPQTVGLGKIPTSCCGEGDAYYADETIVRDGKSYAVITDERDDEPLERVHVPIGTEYEIPPSQIVGKEQIVKGNPTGHVIVFLGTIYEGDVRTRPVLCYVQNWGV